MLLPVYFDKYWNNYEFMENLYNNILDIASIF